MLSHIKWHSVHEEAFLKFEQKKMLANDSTKHDTAVIIVLFTELFDVKRNRGSRNKVFACSCWESAKSSYKAVYCYSFRTIIYVVLCQNFEIHILYSLHVWKIPSIKLQSKRLLKSCLQTRVEGPVYIVGLLEAGASTAHLSDVKWFISSGSRCSVAHYYFRSTNI